VSFDGSQYGFAATLRRNLDSAVEVRRSQTAPRELALVLLKNNEGSIPGGFVFRPMAILDLASTFVMAIVIVATARHLVEILK
jgi:hypothetical protein